MKKWVIVAAAFVVIASALFVYIKKAEHTIVINGHTITVEVENTDVAREKGLSGRGSLAPDHGMLFVFEKDGIYQFWMKDMRFPIDIIWISSSGAVIDFSENVTPDTYPQTFSSRAPARYVLELTAHAVKRLNMHVGDIVRL